MDKLNTYTYSKVPIAKSQTVNVVQLEDYAELINFNYNRIYKIYNYAMIFVTAGKTEYVVDFNTINVNAGEVLFLSPGQTFNCINPCEVSGFIVSFGEDFLRSNYDPGLFTSIFDFFKNLSQENKIRISEHLREYVCRLVDLIDTEVRLRSKERNHVVLYHLMSSLFHILNRSNTHFPNEEVIIAEKKLAVKYKFLVQQNVNIKNNVEFFCDKMRISKSTLQKATKYTFQKTPKDIIEEVIILEAKRLLAVSENQIQEIAYSLGFNEPTNFTKFFKRNIGITPDYFRKSLLSKS